MRIDPANLDKFAKLFGAGAHKPRPRKRSKPTVEPVQQDDTSYDDTIPLDTRLYTNQREREIEALQREQRLWKRYQANRQCRLDRITREFQGAGKFLRAIAKAEAGIDALAYRDVDADLAALASRFSLASIPNAYDRFTVYEEVVGLVLRVCKRAGYTTHDPDLFFEVCAPTALDELKAELNLT